MSLVRLHAESGEPVYVNPVFVVKVSTHYRGLCDGRPRYGSWIDLAPGGYARVVEEQHEVIRLLEEARP